MLLLCVFDVQLRFSKQAHEGAQLEPSLCRCWWVMSQLHIHGGLNDFIFFNAHFLSVNVFQGEGVFLMCFMCVLVYNGILDRVGINPGKQTMYHMCKTWLQKVHSGWNMGGVTWK